MPLSPYTPEDENIERYYLYPGEIFYSKTPHIVDTVLGSCIAVFLWDPVLKSGGINHYMLPFSNKKDKQLFKYGNIAIPELIRRMLKTGSRKSNLKAKVFGGSETARLNPAFNIGERNILLAQELLHKEKIPIISHSLGGSQGRKVIFYTATGDVFINYIGKEVNDIDKENLNKNITSG